MQGKVYGGDQPQSTKLAVAEQRATPQLMRTGFIVFTHASNQVAHDASMWD